MRMQVRSPSTISRELRRNACHGGYAGAPALELAHAVKTTNFDRRACHQHAVQRFHADIMARNYLQVYQRILDGETLHQHQPFIQGDARNLPWGD